MREKILDPMIWFTALLVVVGILQWRTLDRTDTTLKLQQRAQISPMGVKLISPIQLNQPITMLIAFTNSGREPATDVYVNVQNDVIESYNLSNIDMNDIPVPENKTCEDEGGTARGIMPPSNGNMAVGFTESSAFGKPRYVADDKIISQAKFYVIQGCIRYKTLGERKKSGFCYVMQPEKMITQVFGQNSVAIAPFPADASQGGNAQAPQTTPMAPQVPLGPQLMVQTQGYVFATCRSGFDSD